MSNLAEFIREQIKKDDVLGNIKEDLINALVTNIRKEGKAHIRYTSLKEEGTEKPDYWDTYYIRICWDHELALKMWLSEQGFKYYDTYAHRTGIRGLDVTV